MESSGAGTLVAPLPNHSHTPDPFYRLTTANTVPAFDDFSFPGPADPTTTLDTPVHRPSIDHFQASNVRGGGGGAELQASPTNIDAAKAANILANTDHVFPTDDWTQGLQSYTSAADPVVDDDFGAFLANITAGKDAAAEESAGLEWMQEAAEDQEEDERKDVKAYAKLGFPDGDYYITTFQVTLGRDMDFHKQVTREEKLQRRAQQELDDYKLEPSQASQPEEVENGKPDHSSKSSQSLEGRPARALPSNFSEQGGAVSFAAQSDDGAESRHAKRKRRLLYSKSSSTTSVAPANLHLSTTSDFAQSHPFSAGVGATRDQSSHAFVPVHPQIAGDIRKISKEHLLFSYNFDDETWEVQVLGNGAFINYTHYRRDQVVQLNHHDKIQVASLDIEFKLPDAYRASPGPSRGTFNSEDDLDDEADEAESPLRTSAIGRSSNAMLVGDSDDEDDEPLARVVAQKKPKIKLSLKKKKAPKEDEVEKVVEIAKPAKVTAKQKRQEQSAELSPEAVKKPDKGKKPRTAGKQPAKEPIAEPIKEPVTEPIAQPGVEPIVGVAEPVKEEKDEKVSPPAPPPVIEPGSIFEGVAAEELPQKRKGPGRPPKNGLISKRDQSFVKRKLKEYEKRGLPPPPMDELVAQVRAEQKQKEAAAKAAARGEAPPDTVMQSIETELSNLTAPRSDVMQPPMFIDPQISATPLEPLGKSSPKSKRIVKSPSPMKPESECTEEEMKKPAITYVHILDEVLRDHPIGKADLQEIYDRICKRYPYYKYRVNTAGWQSSVRHNLLQHERFKEDGRSGKGRLWAVNYDCPLDREKKRRVTPPPRPYPQQMQNGPTGAPGQMQPYGHQHYGGPYGQPVANGQPPYPSAAPQPGSSAYYSPYAPSQPGQPGPYGPPLPSQPGAPPAPHMMAQQPHARPPYPHPAHPPAHGTTPRPQPTPQPRPQAPQFQGIVDEIMAYRSHFLSRFQPDTEVFKLHDDMFKKCTNLISGVFHGTNAEARPELSEEERRVFGDLEAIFKRYEHLKGPPKEGSHSGTPAAEARPPVSAIASGSGGAGGSGGIGQAVGVATEGTSAGTIAGAPSGAPASAQVPVPAPTPSAYHTSAPHPPPVDDDLSIVESASTAPVQRYTHNPSSMPPPTEPLVSPRVAPPPPPAPHGPSSALTAMNAPLPPTPAMYAPPPSPAMTGPPPSPAMTGPPPPPAVNGPPPPTAVDAPPPTLAAGVKRPAETEGDEGVRDTKRMTT